MIKEFREWWFNGGAEAWAKAIDNKGGSLAAIEMVFNNGLQAGINKTVNSDKGE